MISDAYRFTYLGCAGVPQIFPFPFKVFSVDEIEVILIGPARGMLNPVHRNIHYEVQLRPDQDDYPGGEIIGTFAAGCLLYIAAKTDGAQSVRLQAPSIMYPKLVEVALDRNAANQLEIRDTLLRTLIAPIGTPLDQFAAETKSLVAQIAAATVTESMLATGSEHALLHERINYRLGLLDGTVAGPSGAPSPPPPPVTASRTFDFTKGTVPAGVAVSRSGTAGTYINAQGVLVTAPANTPRIQHVAGVPVGIYCEKARTNSLVDGQFPGTGAGWTNLGTPTGAFVPGAGPSPDGDADGASHFFLAPVAGYFGKRRLITGLAGTEEIHASIYLKSLSANSELGGLPGAWVKPPMDAFARYEFMHPPTTGFNVDLIGSSGASVAQLLWGASVVEGGKVGESLILTAGSAVTRPKELVTLTVGETGTRDVLVTYAGGATQVLPSEAVAGTWVLDADDLTGNLVARVQFLAAGTAPAPAPAPVPTPAPTPAPGPSPSPGAVWTQEMLTAAIAQSNGVNQGVIQGMGSNTVGWRGGSSLGLGRRWNNKDPKGWDWPEGEWGDDHWYEWVECWSIICHEEGSSGIGAIDFRNFDFQVQYIDTGRWVRHQPKSSSVRWSANYGLDLSTKEFIEDNTPTQERPGLDGGTSLIIPQNTYPHWIPGIPMIRVPNIYRTVNGQKVNNMKSVMVSCEMRRDPRSDAGFKGLIHISADPKPNGTGYQGGLPWFVQFHTTISMRATSSWQRMTAFPLKPTYDTLTDRMVTEADIRANPPLM